MTKKLTSKCFKNLWNLNPKFSNRCIETHPGLLVIGSVKTRFCLGLNMIELSNVCFLIVNIIVIELSIIFHKVIVIQQRRKNTFLSC